MDKRNSEDDPENEEERGVVALPLPVRIVSQQDRPKAPGSQEAGSGYDHAVRGKMGVGLIQNPPKKPIISLESTDGKTVTVKWKVQDPETSYYSVYWEPNKGDSPKETDKHEVSISLNAGIEYLIWVEAVSQGQAVTPSAKLRFRSAPKSPTELNSVQYSDDAITVSFKDPNPAVWGKTYRVTVMGANLKKIEQTTEKQFCTVEDLFPNARYTISVQAIEENQYGTFESVKTYHAFLLKPLQPSNIECNQRGLKYHVTWDTSIGASHYKLSCIGDADEGKLQSIELKISQTDCYLNLDKGQHYEIRITAVNDAGDSRTGVLHYYTKPSQPTNINCNQRGERYHVTWDSVARASHYNLVCMGESDEEKLQPTESKIPQCYLTLEEERHYEIRITAVNDAGESRTGVLHFDTNPLPPTEIFVNPENHWIRVSFEDSISLPKTYTVIATPVEGGKPLKLRTETNTCLLKELNPGREYEIYVAAEYNGMTSMRKRYKTPVRTRLLPPTGLKCHPDGPGALVTWERVNGAKKYILRFGGSGNGKTLEDLETMATEIRLDALKLDQSYEIRLYCVDDADKESMPAILHYYTGPSRPYCISVKPGIDSVEVSYQDDERTDKIYTVVATPIGEGGPVKGTTLAHTAKLNGLDPAKQYEICVFSECYGRKSTAARFEKPVCTRLLPPTALECQADGLGYHLVSWQPVNGAKKYILRCESSLDGKALPDIETMATKIRLNALKIDQSYEILLYCIDGTGEESLPQRVLYYTGPSAPDVISVTEASESIRVNFKDSGGSQKTYRVIATPVAGGKQIERETEIHAALLDGFEPGKEYEIYIIAECNGRRSQKARYEKLVRTRLASASNIKCKPEKSGHRVSWDPVPGANHYMLRFDGEQPLRAIKTQSTEIYLNILEPERSYDISVFAVDDVGAESMPAVRHYNTGPSPPSAVSVAPRKDSVEVRYQDKGSEKTFTAVATPIEGGEPVQKKTKGKTVLLTGLNPAKQYEVCVFSECDGKKSPMARYRELVRTLPTEVRNLRWKPQNGGVCFEWDKLESQERFLIQWRIDNEPIKDEPTEAPMFPIFNLEPTRCYSVRVMAKNSSGDGPVTNWVNYTLAPRTPTGLQIKILSCIRVKFTCDETVGATSYVFDVNGESHEAEEPAFVLTHDEETVNFDVRVSAKNNGGRSLPSSVVNYSKSTTKAFGGCVRLLDGQGSSMMQGGAAPIDIEKTIEDERMMKMSFYLSEVLGTLPNFKIKELTEELQKDFGIYSVPDDLYFVELMDFESLKTLRSVQKNKFLLHVRRIQEGRLLSRNDATT